MKKRKVQDSLMLRTLQTVRCHSGDLLISMAVWTAPLPAWALILTVSAAALQWNEPA